MTEHFFIVGAQRSGTTYLYQLLDEHPEIQMNKPARPEPKFFLKEGSEQRVDEYLATYFAGNGAPLRGDKSTSYIESGAAAQRIARCFPDAKILFMLRDPVDRAISNYWFSVANKFENRSLEEALREDQVDNRSFDSTAVSMSPFAYLERGRYAECIDLYSPCFRRQQMKILVLEHFVGNLDAVKDLCEFLGVSRDFIPRTLDEKVNESPTGVPDPSPELERFLRSYFREANQRLSARYGVDTAAWKA